MNINILVTLDQNYILPLKVLLVSLFENNSGSRFSVYMVYSGIPEAELDELRDMAARYGSELIPLVMNDALFEEAPVVSHYTKAMYYRLLAHEVLPKQLDKILYLDPDILVINSIGELYSTELSEYLYAAACHTFLTSMTKHINKLRLNSYDMEGYFNSGVLLMNLSRQRERVHREDIFSFIEENRNKLILPDQDVLNGLYGEEILPLDDSLYNFDARKSKTYFMASSGQKDIEWVMKNTVLLHFCGKQKPWIKNCQNRFNVLYKHYMNKAERIAGEESKEILPAALRF